jgi:hypothetical protein
LTQVALELNKRDDIALTVYSFKRLYPALLFSGIDDKDSERSVPEILNCQFTLDTINSLSWFAVIKRLKCNNTNLVVIPAWTFLLHLAWVLLLNNVKNTVTTTTRNAFDHEAGGIKNALMRY